MRVKNGRFVTTKEAVYFSADTLGYIGTMGNASLRFQGKMAGTAVDLCK